MTLDLSMFHDGEGNELERPESKSLPEVLACIDHYSDVDSLVPKLFAEMYVVGVQWDWYERYKEWDVLVDGLDPAYTAPPMPERPPLQTAQSVLDNAPEGATRGGDQIVMAGATYTPDIALDQKYTHINLIVNVKDLANNLINSYDVRLINRPSGVQRALVTTLGSEEHSFTDGATIGATIGGGFVRLDLPTTGGGESLSIDYYITFSR